MSRTVLRVAVPLMGLLLLLMTGAALAAPLRTPETPPIVYRRLEGTGNQRYGRLYATNLRGGFQRPLTSPTEDVPTDWSVENGVAVIATTDRRRNMITLIDVQSGVRAPYRRCNNFCTRPAFDPTGTYLTYETILAITYVDYVHLRHLDRLDDRQPTLEPVRALNPTRVLWSPVAPRLLVQGDSIQWMNAETGTVETAFMPQAAWGTLAPDGGGTLSLSFSNEYGSFMEGLHRYDFDTARYQRVTDARGAREHTATLGPTTETITVARQPLNQDRRVPDSDIWILQLDGTRSDPLLVSEQHIDTPIDWDEGGRYLLFRRELNFDDSGLNRSPELWVYDLERDEASAVHRVWGFVDARWAG